LFDLTWRRSVATETFGEEPKLGGNASAADTTASDRTIAAKIGLIIAKSLPWFGEKTLELGASRICAEPATHSGNVSDREGFRAHVYAVALDAPEKS